MLENLYLLNYIIIGSLLGATLNYFQFGFSSSFRSLIVDNNTLGFRALLWMLGFAILLFSPLLAIESWQGQTFQGFIRPLSLAIPIGAFLFGIGMQIGCGCTSGTLNRVGQLQPLSFTTLAFMIVGGTIAAATFNDWQALPTSQAIAFQSSFGWLPGLAIQLIILLGLYKALTRHEQKHTGQVEPLFGSESWKFHPYLLAGLLLSTLNAALFFTTGAPWSISSAFPFWGIKLIDLTGLPIDWHFWDYAMENSSSLNQTLFTNPVSLTTLGVVFGALIVSIVHPRAKIKATPTRLLMSISGGLIMGFGAVMASGCNIGAFFSGIASGSLHGWVWLVFALFGNILGLRARAYLMK
ncbi:MAG: YeeE/YedE family protein [Thiomicrorhabdus sp.]|jgi:uncharacterized membrane protein YedE/YeeE|nr:YeeE/YedE family protein [Thiomicrorhabdus sp.]